jgi:hypothetical protein
VTLQFGASFTDNTRSVNYDRNTCIIQATVRSRFQPVSCSLFLPFQVFSVDGFVADGTLSPAVVGQGQVVEDARPAEDVAAAGDLGRSGRVEAAKKTRVC